MQTLAREQKSNARPAPAEQRRVFTLRCFVYRRGSKFIAECIDLDLIVRADSPTKALASLKDAMLGYLETVLEGDIQGLLPRRSPLGHRLRYHCYCLLAAFSSQRDNFRLCDLSSDQLIGCYC